MTTDHTSKDFDQALQRARTLVEQMGARVERQLIDALDALRHGAAQRNDRPRARG